MTSNKFIQRVFRRASPGAFHRQLGIPVDQRIPIHLLETIKNSEVGNYVTGLDGNKVRVTPLLKKRANLLINLDRFRR